MTTVLLRMRHALMRTFLLSFAAAREIFDESAYARFLARHHTQSSPQAYSAFIREQAQAQSRRHRCC